MFLRMAFALAFCVGAAAPGLAAADDDAVESEASGKDYYSEPKQLACSNQQLCTVAFAKVPKNRTLTAAHISCVVGTTTPLGAVFLSRGSTKNSVDLSKALVALEKPASITANGTTLTGYNQDVVYRAKSGLYPLILAQTTAVGTIQLGCILSGRLD